MDQSCRQGVPDCDQGCYFSIQSQVGRRSLRSTLLERDPGYGDLPVVVPCRMQWLDYF